MTVDHVITVADILIWSGFAVLVIGIIGGALWLLSIFADAFKH